jgi:dipeptidyl aminopeptidase/acylaminoacyl peptidase
VDPRFKAAVTNVGGLDVTRWQPEADPLNFVSRVSQPFLMINGQFDIVFPYETAQLPMYRLLATPDGQKYHHVTPAAHSVPKIEVIKETLDWFDRYLGPTGGG